MVTGDRRLIDAGGTNPPARMTKTTGGASSPTSRPTSSSATALSSTRSRATRRRRRRSRRYRCASLRRSAISEAGTTARFGLHRARPAQAACPAKPRARSTACSIPSTATTCRSSTRASKAMSASRCRSPTSRPVGWQPLPASGRIWVYVPQDPARPGRARRRARRSRRGIPAAGILHRRRRRRRPRIRPGFRARNSGDDGRLEQILAERPGTRRAVPGCATPSAARVDAILAKSSTASTLMKVRLFPEDYTSHLMMAPAK